MSKLKTVGNVLFVLSILSMPISFMLSTTIGEVEIFEIAGIIRYSWVAYFFLPICILCFIVGGRLKRNGERYKKQYVAAIICIPLLLIFGSFRFIFAEFHEYDADELFEVQEKVGIDIPKNVDVVSTREKDYVISYVKITDEKENYEYEELIENNDKWTVTLDSIICNALPFDMSLEMDNFDYFLFYNETKNEYNVYPQGGRNSCVFIAYDVQTSRLIILNEYVIF